MNSKKPRVDLRFTSLFDLFKLQKILLNRLHIKYPLNSWNYYAQDQIRQTLFLASHEIHEAIE